MQHMRVYVLVFLAISTWIAVVVSTPMVDNKCINVDPGSCHTTFTRPECLDAGADLTMTPLVLCQQAGSTRLVEVDIAQAALGGGVPGGTGVITDCTFDVERQVGISSTFFNLFSGTCTGGPFSSIIDPPDDDFGDVRLVLTSVTCPSPPCEGYRIVFDFTRCTDSVDPVFIPAAPPDSEMGSGSNSPHSCSSAKLNVLAPAFSLGISDSYAEDMCFPVTVTQNLIEDAHLVMGVWVADWEADTPDVGPPFDPNCRMEVQQRAKENHFWSAFDGRVETVNGGTGPTRGVWFYDDEPPMVSFPNPELFLECDGPLQSYVDDIEDHTGGGTFQMDVMDDCFTQSSLYTSQRGQYILARPNEVSLAKVPDRARLGLHTITPGCGGWSIDTAEWRVRARDFCGWVSDEEILTIHWEDTTNPTWDSGLLPSISISSPCYQPTVANLISMGGYMNNQVEPRNPTDTCSGVGTVEVSDSTICTMSGIEITRTWSIPDLCGNTATPSQVISVAGTFMPGDVTFDPPTTDWTYPCEGAPLMFPATVTASHPCISDDIAVTCVDGDGMTCPGENVFTRTCTAVALDCLTAQITYTIGPTDSDPPTFTSFPPDVTVECSEDTSPANTGTPTATDACSTATVMQGMETTSGAGCNSGDYTIERQWIATDECGNSIAATQTITVEDTTPPVVTAPPDQSMVLCDAVLDPATYGTATVMEDCNPQPATYSDSYTIDCVSTVERTWTSTDGCNPPQSAVQTISLINPTPPTITAPSDVMLECGQSTAPADTGTGVPMDDCWDATVVTTFTDDQTFTCGNAGFISRTWRATDLCGQFDEDGQVLTLVDTLDPVINIGGAIDGITIPCTMGTSPASTGSPTATDMCDGPLPVFYSDGAVSPCVGGLRSFTRTWTATDGCGHTATYEQEINIIDNTAPVVSPLPTETVECGLPDPFVVLSSPSVTEDCPFGYTLDFVDMVIPTGCGLETEIRRTWTADDGCQTSLPETQTVIEVDSLAPDLSVPPDIDAECGVTTDFGTAVATDRCSSMVDIVVSEDLTFTGCGGNFINVRTFTATDECGMVSMGVQTVTSRDVTAPSFTYVPEDVVLECPSSATLLETGGTAAAVDICSGTTISFTDETTLGCGNTYSIERRWSAEDECSNENFRFQTITIADRTPPTVAPPAPVVIECPAASVDPADLGFATGLDGCGSTTIDYEDEKTLTCGGTFRIQRDWTATDECNLRDTKPQIISVVDTTVPTLTIPPDYVSTCGSGEVLSPGGVTGVASAVDSCYPTVDLSFSDQVVPMCGGTHLIRRSWSASDRCTTATEVQEILVEDSTPPIITSVVDLQVECGEDVPVVPPTATDECSSDGAIEYLPTDSSETAGACPVAFFFTRNWVVDDGCGNVVSAPQVIEKVDTTPPVVTATPSFVTECDTPFISPFVGATAVDSCFGTIAPGSITSSTVTTPICGNSRKEITTFTATDSCSNVGSATTTIELRDTLAPELTIPPPTQIECDGPVEDFSELMILPTATDRCADPGTLQFSYVDRHDRSCGESSFAGTLERTWRVADPCDNDESGRQTLRIVDTTPPVLVVPAESITLECGDDTSPDGPAGWAVATDSCDSEVSLDYSDLHIGLTGVFHRRWVAADGCGNTAIATQTISVVDSDIPIIETLPNAVLECGDSLDAVEVPSVWDECDMTVEVAFTTVVENLSCGQSRHTITYTAQDKAGNNAVPVVRTVTLLDTTPPVISPVPNVQVECGNSLAPVSVPAVADACSTIPIVPSFADTVVESGCGDTGVIRRTWTATDECGLQAMLEQLITVVDTVPPSVNPIPSVTVACPAEDADLLPAETGTPTAAPDACGDVAFTYSDTQLSGNFCPGERQISRRWVASDECGLSTVTFQNIMVRDMTAPSLVIPPTFTQECGEDTDPELAGIATATDTCDNDVEVAYQDFITSDGTVCAVHHNRRWTAEDNCRNNAFAVQTIIVEDTTPPSITAPDGETYECGESLPTPNVRDAEVSDICLNDRFLTVSYSDTVTPLCGVGGGARRITREWMVADNCPLSATDVQVIEVLDTVPPELSIPRSKVVECGSDTGDAANGMATARDVCDPSPTISFSDSFTPSCGGTGVIRREWQALDDCLLSSTGVQEITVIDTTPPGLTIPAPATVECGTPYDPSVTGTAVANDLCGGASVSYEDFVSNSCGGAGIVSRVWTATDDCGNFVQDTQFITLVDTEAPQVAMVTMLNLNCEDSTEPTDATTPDVTLERCSPTDIVTTYRDTVNPQCGGTSVIYRDWTVTDACGLTTIVQQTLDISDVTPPVVQFPANTDISCMEDDSPEANGIPIASDTCSNGFSVSFMDNDVPDGCGVVRRERTWTVENDCGLTATQVQTITISDKGPPEIVSGPGTVEVECGESTHQSDVGVPVGSDDCFSPTIVGVNDVVTNTCGDAGQIVRTFTFSDDCMQLTDYTHTINVVDTVSPSFLTTLSDEVLECGALGAPTMTPGASDACSSVSVTFEDDLIPGCGSSHTTVRTWIARDECGLRVNSIQEIEFRDTTPPVIGLKVPSVLLECDESTVPPPMSASAFDLCEPDTSELTYEDGAAVPGRCEDDYSFTRTWKARDGCDNEAQAEQPIVVSDSTAPTITVDPRTVAHTCDKTIDFGTTLFGTVTVGDNCDEDPTILITDSPVVPITVLSDLSVVSDPGVMTCPPPPTEMMGTKPAAPAPVEWIIERAYTPRDRCGNLGKGVTQTITVTDNDPPQFTHVPEDIVVGCLDDTSPATTGTALAEDACTATTVYHTDSVSGTACSTVITRTWTAIDKSRLCATVDQIITVEDRDPPELTVPDDLVLECGEFTSIDDVAGVPIAVDSCGGVHLDVATTTEIICGGAQSIVRTFTATDDCGNVATGTQTIVVEDSTAPQLIIPGDVDRECGDAPSDAHDAVAEDACGESQLAFADEVIVSLCNGLATAITRQWTAVDECGNSVTGDHVITTIDSTSPELDVPPDVVLECGEDTSPDGMSQWAATTDKCDPQVLLSYEDTFVPGMCGSSGVIFRRWIAVDACGNTAADVQQITISDTKGPEFVSGAIDTHVEVACEEYEPIRESVLVEDSSEMVIDQCGSAIVSFVDVDVSEQQLLCIADTVITRVWTAVDDCGFQTQLPQFLELKAAFVVNMGGADEVEVEYEYGYDSMDDGDGGGSPTPVIAPVDLCQGLVGFELESCFVGQPKQIVGREDLSIDLVIGEQSVGRLRLPETAIGGVVVVGPSFAPPVDGTVAPAVEITLVSTQGGAMGVDGNVEVCLTLDEPSSRSDLCLAFFDPVTNEWKCEDDCLPVEDETRRCGTSPHLTSFSVLLGGAAGGSGDCSSNNPYITGYWEWDFLLIILSVVGLSACCVLLILVFLYSRRGKRLLYGKEGYRVHTQRMMTNHVKHDLAKGVGDMAEESFM